VLDPYTFTTEQAGKSGNGRASTLGEAQYRWLEQTLQSSNAKWKFVLLHHLIGGIGKDQRGGAEAAQYFEWGDLSVNGTDQFNQQRIGRTVESSISSFRSLQPRTTVYATPRITATSPKHSCLRRVFCAW